MTKATMLSTNWREVTGAVSGAIVSAVIPLVLHMEAARVGDAELCGVPLAFFSLPTFFVGAISGAYLARKRA